MYISVKLITARETYPVRHPVLRAGRPLEDCAFDSDDLETTMHLGAYLEDQLVGVATFVLNNDARIPALAAVALEKCYQLRGMAVLENLQGKNIGRKLLMHGESLLKQNGTTHLWFNARELAIPFYKKLGYLIVSDIFEIVPIGMHYKMHKSL